MDNEELRKTIERQRRLGFGFRWDGLGDWQTDAIFAKLREWGVDTSVEQFPVQAKAAGEPSELYEQWHERIQQYADDHNLDLRFWGDFALIASEELWERLTPDLACADTVANYFTDAIGTDRKRKRHPVAKHPEPRANALLHLADYLQEFPPKGRDAHFEEVEEAAQVDLSGYMTDGMFILAEDRPADAIRVADVLATLQRFPSIQNEVTTALAHAGHRELSMQRAQAGLEMFPAGFSEYCTAAEVYHLFGDDRYALELLEKARELVEDTTDLAIVESQIAMIANARQKKEAARSAMAEREPYGPPHPTQPLKHSDAAFQAGPNARCPCGSGKKFKICCGRLG